MAIAFLGAAEVTSAQISVGSSLPPSVPPVVQAAMDEPWPAVDLGLQPMAPEAGTLGRRVVVPLQLEGPPPLALQFGTENVVMQFQAAENTVLGPIIDLGKSLPETPKVAAETAGPESQPGPWQLGNVSFNRTAESFNLDKGDDVRKDDLSRQLGKVGGSPGIATSTPITVWAIAGVAMLVALIAMAIGNFENDKDDRKRRKKARRHRRHHSI
jgi:hypothetical protein